MRNRHDPLTKRLLAWGWAWGDKLERQAVPASIPCTLGHDGPGNSVPGHRILMAPHDWLPPDVVTTHRAFESLPIHQRAVVWSHYVTGHVPLKVRCARLAVAVSVYYQRLDYAHRGIRKALNRRDMEVFHMEQGGQSA